MGFTGNAVANAYFEGDLPPNYLRPSPHNVEGKPTVELTAFIRDKYSHKFALPGATWPPLPPPELAHALVRRPSEPYPQNPKP